jgi:hypothetical protein
MTTATKDPLAKYRRAGSKPFQQAQSSSTTVTATSASKPAYEAFRPSKEAQRYLEIRPRFPEPAECPMNSMITSIRVEWRWGMAVTLIYGTTMMININGERLQPLYEALRDWKVAWIAEFDPDSHDLPQGEDAPFIKSIEIITERPEPLPPMNARH